MKLQGKPVLCAIAACALVAVLCSCSGGTSADGSSSGSSGSSGSGTNTAVDKTSSKNSGSTVNATLGDFYQLDYCDIIFNSAEWLDEISYHEEGDHISYSSTPGEYKEGKTYFAVNASFKNTYTKELYLGNVMKASIAIGEYTYEADVRRASARSGIAQFEALDAGEIVIYASIPNELKDGDKSPVVTVGFASSGDSHVSDVEKAATKYVLTF